MTSQETTPITSSRKEQATRYEKAKTVRLSQKMSTTVTTETLRTVTTSLTKGKLELRYTPLDIIPKKWRNAFVT